MTFWLIAAAVLVVGLALAWWAGGRAKPVARDRSLTSDMQIRDGRDNGRSSAYGPY